MRAIRSFRTPQYLGQNVDSFHSDGSLEIHTHSLFLICVHIDWVSETRRMIWFDMVMGSGGGGSSAGIERGFFVKGGGVRRMTVKTWTVCRT